jgi:hypothetical protein
MDPLEPLTMPALVRVGAIAERTRALRQEAGIPVLEDRTTPAQLENGNLTDLRLRFWEARGLGRRRSGDPRAPFVLL